jgi:hypothetical protein
VEHEWVLLKQLGDELGIKDSHPNRWAIWATIGFRPTRITIRSKTGIVQRWAVTIEQAQRIHELYASALTLT